jgi:hypothetical protein
VKFSDYNRTYVLMVDERVGEYDRLSIMLQEQGVFPHFWINGMGRLLPMRYYNVVNDVDIPSDWCDTIGAYYFSDNFRRIIREAQEQNLQNILFCEDDLILTDNFKEILEIASPQVPEDWDLLYYGANHSSFEVEHVTENVLKLHGCYSTHCVGIRNTIFQQILDLPNWRVLDYMLCHFLIPKCNAYGVWPGIAVQKPGHSYLQGFHADYTNLFKTKGAIAQKGGR